MSLGTWQGCQLTLLLFLLTVVALGLALQRDTPLKRLEAPGLPGQTNLLTASPPRFFHRKWANPAIFKYCQLCTSAEELACSTIQASSFFNKAIAVGCYEEINGVQPADTTRYMVYDINTEN